SDGLSCDLGFSDLNRSQGGLGKGGHEHLPHRRAAAEAAEAAAPEATKAATAAPRRIAHTPSRAFQAGQRYLFEFAESIAMAAEQLSRRCCIVGGGPCGLMLGFLLARAGVDVVVLEKHGDFLRDFRGDTIHPSTLDVMGELGLLDDFLKLPHQKAPNISAYF